MLAVAVLVAVRRFLVFSQPPLNVFSSTGARLDVGTGMDKVLNG
jgi:hypothetical protein